MIIGVLMLWFWGKNWESCGIKTITDAHVLFITCENQFWNMGGKKIMDLLGIHQILSTQDEKYHFTRL